MRWPGEVASGDGELPSPSSSQNKARHGRSARRRVQGLQQHQATLQRLKLESGKTPILLHRYESGLPDSVCSWKWEPVQLLRATLHFFFCWFPDPDVEREYRSDSARGGQNLACHLPPLCNSPMSRRVRAPTRVRAWLPSSQELCIRAQHPSTRQLSAHRRPPLRYGTHD